MEGAAPPLTLFVLKAIYQHQTGIDSPHGFTHFTWQIQILFIQIKILHPTQSFFSDGQFSELSCAEDHQPPGISKKF